MAFYVTVAFLIGVGLLLSVGVHVWWQASGRLMLGLGAVALLSGYVTAGLGQRAPLLGLAAGTGACALLGVGLGAISRRLRPEEFLLLSLALAEVIRRLAYHFRGWTGGSSGLRVGSPFVGNTLLLCGTAALALVLLWSVQRWWGRPSGLALRATGEARDGAAALGIHPERTDLLAGALLGGAAGLAGSLYALGLGFLHPEDLGLSVSLAAVAVGLAVRPKRLFAQGAVLAVVLFGARDLLRILEVGGTMRFAVYDVLVGLAVIASAVYMRSVTLR